MTNNKTNNDWKKIEPGDAWDFDEKPEMIGIYLGAKNGVGPNKANLYEFKSGDESVSVWGTSILDARLKNLEKGEEVKIVFLGKEISPKTGREYRNFDVFHRMPQEQGKEISEEDIPIINE